MYEKEYYVIKPGGPNRQKRPSLMWHTPSGSGRKFVGRGEKYKGPLPIIFSFDYSVPDNLKYEMCDYHTVSQMVISKKLKDVLEPMNIAGIQLIEAMIYGFKHDQEQFKDYFYLHILKQNQLKCIDRELSEFRATRSGRIMTFQKLILDKEMLDSIPQEERLFVEVEGGPILYICHESIKNILEAAKPDGMVFYRIDKWNSDSVFG